MEYKIAVCDDSGADRAYLTELTRRWAGLREYGVTLREFPSAESFLFHYAEESDYDILLLDIELGGMDGVALARELRRENDAVQIIFVTGYSDYIAEGYEVEALHYLMKPVGEDKLRAVLDRAADKLRSNERALCLEVGGELIRLPIRQIRYAEVMGNYVTIHARRDYTVKMPLGELAAQLDERFYRVGRSAVVNLTKVGRVTRAEVILDDGAAIPLPRGAYEGVNRAIIALN